MTKLVLSFLLCVVMRISREQHGKTNIPVLMISQHYPFMQALCVLANQTMINTLSHRSLDFTCSFLMDHMGVRHSILVSENNVNTSLNDHTVTAIFLAT